MKNCTNISIPKIKTLKIHKIDQADDSVSTQFLNFLGENFEDEKSMKSSLSPKEIINLYIDCSILSDKTFSALIKVVKKVKGELYLSRLELDNNMINSLFENCQSNQRLIFNSCKLKITAGFSLNISKKYKLTELGFFDSFMNNSRNFEDFINQLSKTNLNNSGVKLYFKEVFNFRGEFVSCEDLRIKQAIKDFMTPIFVVENKEFLNRSSYSGFVRLKEDGSFERYGAGVNEGLFNRWECTHKDGKIHGYYFEQNKKNKNEFARTYWSEGNWHGLRMEQSLNEGETSVEYEIKENAKRARKITGEEAEKINNGDTFWFSYFKHKDSIQKLYGVYIDETGELQCSQKFLEPREHTILMSEVRERIKLCQEKNVNQLEMSSELISDEGKKFLSELQLISKETFINHLKEQYITFRKERSLFVEEDKEDIDYWNENSDFTIQELTFMKINIILKIGLKSALLGEHSSLEIVKEAPNPKD